MNDELATQNQGRLTLKALDTKIELLEEQIRRQADEIESLNARLPDSHIISPHFLKRAFTVWGHYIVAGFIIAIPFMCLGMIFVLITGLLAQY